MTAYILRFVARIRRRAEPREEIEINPSALSANECRSRLLAAANASRGVSRRKRHDSTKQIDFFAKCSLVSQFFRRRRQINSRWRAVGERSTLVHRKASYYLVVASFILIEINRSACSLTELPGASV